ncbi:MAG: xylulokinase [Chloroflexota bacterium]|nr:xylulokinase [Chloroflexota bacterium]
MLLGIDISTTGAKAILINDQGDVLETATHTYPLSAPKPLWSEQEPEDWWEATQASIRQLLIQTQIDPKSIHAIGLTGQMHGLVLLDKEDQVLRPAILWNDQRTGKACERLTEIISLRKLISITGNPAMTGFTAPKIIWVKENEPQVYRQIAHILLPKDYIRFKLSGVRAIDCADASGTSLFDISKRTWSKEILSGLEIDPTWLPSVYEGTEITGVISPAGAQATGLAINTPIVGGGGDQAAQAVGVGAVEPGIVAITLGTSGVVFAPTGEPLIDPEGRLHAMCHSLPPSDDQGWHLMGVMLSAAGSLRWFRDTFSPEVSYTKLIEPAGSISPGSDGVLFMPYLTGERCPYADPLARGGFIGLTVRHGMAHITRAVLEGVAFGLRDNLALLKDTGVQSIQQIRISGGGVKSPLWRQIIADVLNVDLVSVNTMEGACYGAALLAGVGVGLWPSVKEACHQVVQSISTTCPNPEHVPVYDTYYQDYQTLYPILKNTFVSLGKKSI